MLWPEGELSKYQTNDIFRAIEASGVPVTNFELTTLHTEILRLKPPVTVIRHHASGSVLAIKPSPEHDTFLTQEQFGPEDKHDLPSRYYWTAVLKTVKGWAEDVGKWIIEADKYAKTPDLWNELYQSKGFFGGPHDQAYENTSFTDSEQTQISEQIRQIKAYLENTCELSGDQMSQVEDRLEQTEQASRHIGRKDWLLLFNGAVFSLMLSDLIPAQAAQHVLVLALHGLGHLFGMGGPPPHLPLAG
jgi:hypothetical protein